MSGPGQLPLKYFSTGSIKRTKLQIGNQRVVILETNVE